MDGAAWIPVLSAMMTVMVSCHQVCFIGSEFNPQSGIPPRWFLPYKDPCECTAIRLGGMHIPASSYRMGAPHYMEELFLSEDSVEIRVYFNCSQETTGCLSPEPLGMEDGTIRDDHIRASGRFGSCCTAQKGRLNSGTVWAPQRDDDNPWIEVIDLTNYGTIVSGVITKSPFHKDHPGYVKKYEVAYKKHPSSAYEHVTDGNGNIKVFVGNTDAGTAVTNLFDENVVATVVRIEPTEWHDQVRMQFELLGCRRN